MLYITVSFCLLIRHCLYYNCCFYWCSSTILTCTFVEWRSFGLEKSWSLLVAAGLCLPIARRTLMYAPWITSWCVVCGVGVGCVCGGGGAILMLCIKFVLCTCSIPYPYTFLFIYTSLNCRKVSFLYMCMYFYSADGYKTCMYTALLLRSRMMMKRPIGGHQWGEEVVPALDCPPHDGTLTEMKCQEQTLMLGEQ